MSTFVDLFRRFFGRKGKFKAFVAEHGSFTFITPPGNLTDVRFQYSTMSFVFYRKFNLLQVVDDDGTVILESNRSISIFSNSKGIDPKQSGKVRPVGLKPSTTYQLNYKGKKPQTLCYVGLYEDGVL